MVRLVNQNQWKRQSKIVSMLMMMRTSVTLTLTQTLSLTIHSKDLMLFACQLSSQMKRWELFLVSQINLLKTRHSKKKPMRTPRTSPASAMLLY